MPGERWPDKRARAVLYAGANKQRRERPEAPDPDAVADAALAVRALLFLDDEVREETADPQAHRIGYVADCMQYATLEPGPDGFVLSLWVGTERVKEAQEELGAEPHDNPFRKLYGWVRIPLDTQADLDRLQAWIQAAFRHAAETKRGQHVSM